MKIKILCGFVWIFLVLWAGVVLAQTESQGISLAKEALTIADSAKSKEDYQRAAQKFEEAMKIGERVKSDKLTGFCSNGLGVIQLRLGQYHKALEYYEQSLAINKKTGNVKGEGQNLCNIGGVYVNLAEYTKALDYYGQPLAIRKKIGDVKGEGETLGSIGWVYVNLAEYTKALDYYGQSLAIRKKTGDVKGEGLVLNDIGVVCKNLGQYTKAIEYNEQALATNKKIGNAIGESGNLGNIGIVYLSLGQYTKALDYLGQSLAIDKKIGNVKSEGYGLNYIGEVYASVGQYVKALEYYEHSLQIRKKTGYVKGQGVTLYNMGQMYALTGKTEDALNAMRQALEISEKLGTPSSGPKNAMANLYLDVGDFTQAENLLKQKGNNLSLGRLALLKSDYPTAAKYYEKAVNSGEKTGNADVLFTSCTGLARAYEGMKNYPKAEEYYEKAMNQVEEIRSGLLPPERTNFFEVKKGGFARSEPAKSLSRVRIKLNHPDASIAPSELTKARSFADHLSQTNAIGATNIPSSLMDKEQSYVNQLAALKKELGETDPEKAPDKFKNLSKSVKDAKDELNAFVDKLWKDYPAYAAVKYPRPPSLKDSALRPEEYAVIFDVSTEGVGVILIRDKAVSKAFYLDLKLSDLERDIMKFREPFEKFRLKDYDPELAKSLYDKLLRPALVDVPKGAPLTIIPDGILAMLPF